MTALLFFVGLLPAVFRSYSVLLYLQPPVALITQVNLGLLLAIIAAVAWALISAGRAYEQAGIPDLHVADDLEIDGDVFRMRLLSKHKDFETTAWLMEVFNEAGAPCLPGRFPLALDWSHHTGNSLVHLTKEISGSVSVAEVKRSTTGLTSKLFYAGAQHKGVIEMPLKGSVYFHIRVEHATRKPIERWFRFERTGEAEFTSHPHALPPFTLRADLLGSKRG